MLRDVVRMIEAAAFLLVALLLMHWVKFGRWQQMFASAPRRSVVAPSNDVIDAVANAIGRAERRLIGRSLKCLPRAMAAQWMLRRRRIASSVVIGATSGLGRERRLYLHAWVECEGLIAIGETEGQPLAPILVLPAF